LAHCLVGNFFGEDDTPTRNDVRRWAQQTWMERMESKSMI